MDGLIECVVVTKSWNGFETVNGKRVRKTFEPGETVRVSPSQLTRSEHLMSSSEHTARAKAEEAAGKRYQRELVDAEGEKEEIENAAVADDETSRQLSNAAQGLESDPEGSEDPEDDDPNSNEDGDNETDG